MGALTMMGLGIYMGCINGRGIGSPLGAGTPLAPYNIGFIGKAFTGKCDCGIIALTGRLGGWAGGNMFGCCGGGLIFAGAVNKPTFFISAW